MAFNEPHYNSELLIFQPHFYKLQYLHPFPFKMIEVAQ